MAEKPCNLLKNGGGRWKIIQSLTVISYSTEYSVTLPEGWTDVCIFACQTSGTVGGVIGILNPYTILHDWFNFGGNTTTGSSGCKMNISYNSSTRVMKYTVENVTWDNTKINSPYIEISAK